MSRSNTKPPPSARKEAIELRVIDAALGLFAERGYHGTTVPQVMDKAGIGAGSLYRLFDSKEALVNAVFRHAKRRLERALRDDFNLDAEPHELFNLFWGRLTAFARAEPVTFRFLELQDHVPYLDGESRSVELGVLGPILAVCLDLQRRGVFRPDLRPDVLIALVWGAFVGLVKAERLGYLKLDDLVSGMARDACFRAIAHVLPSQTSHLETAHADSKRRRKSSSIKSKLAPA